MRQDLSAQYLEGRTEGSLERYFAFCIRKKTAVVGIFFLVTAFCAVLFGMNRITFSWSGYLPQKAESVRAETVFWDEFAQDLPNLEVRISDVSVPQGLRYKEALAQVPEVDAVIWLDDVCNIDVPLEYLENERIQSWYQNRTAVYQVTLSRDADPETLREVRRTIGMNGKLTGAAAEELDRQAAMEQEGWQMVLPVIPLVLLFLVVATRSWGGAVLGTVAAAVSCVIGWGTNCLWAEFSYLSGVAGFLMQVSVSAVFCLIFLKRSEVLFFSDGLKRLEKQTAQASEAAGKEMLGLSLILLIFCLVPLFLKISYGKELGLILLKNLVISVVVIASLLPALLILFRRFVSATSHAPLFFSFDRLAISLMRLWLPILVLTPILMLISCLAWRQSDFYYTDTVSDTIVLLVPRNRPEEELALNEELSSLNGVESVVSYINAVGNAVPDAYLTGEEVREHHSSNYSRFLIVLEQDIGEKRKEDALLAVQNVSEGYYGDQALLAGDRARLRDWEAYFEADRTMLASVVPVILIVVFLLLQRSVFPSLFAVMVSCFAVWLNWELSYFLGEELFALGEMTAGILQMSFCAVSVYWMTSVYLQKRKEMTSRRAIKESLQGGIEEMLFPMLGLVLLDGMVRMVSTDPMLRQMSGMLMRGIALSAGILILTLPPFLLGADRLLERTTLSAGFHRKAMGRKKLHLKHRRRRNGSGREGVSE